MGLVYNGETHWSAMLENIEELRNTIDEHDYIDDVDMGGADGDGTDLLFGATNLFSLPDILSQFLPPKQEADRLVAAYFRAKAITAPWLHTAHFSRLYRLFWDNQVTASPLWTSMLFSILHVATRTLSPTTEDDAGDRSKSNHFARAAAHCLAVGEYYRPQRLAVEALLLYIHSKCLTSLVISPEVASLFGTLVRLETIMGYHRDPDRCRGMSAFDREMRRRTWSLCMQLDMLVSFQLGLPSNVQFPTWDTRPPTSLLDSDFDEDTKELPPPRPESEPTELLFYIAKHKLMAVFEKIIRHTQSATEVPSDQPGLIDQELRDTYAALPAVFHDRSMADSIVDPPSLVVTRLCVFFIYQKCRCVLHRQYVTRGSQGSVQTCYDAATNLVRRFLDVYKEFDSGGQLASERWFMGSLTWHDFLLGCTALCLTVCSTRHYVAQYASTAIVDVVGSLQLLQDAKNVCEKQSARSRDTRKVRQLTEATILRFSNRKNGCEPTISLWSPTSQAAEHDANWPAIPTAEGDPDWLWSESAIGAEDGATWAYMKQFLDLPKDDLMIDT